MDHLTSECSRRETIHLIPILLAMADPKEAVDWWDSNTTFWRPGKASMNEQEGYLLIEGSGWNGPEHWIGLHRIPLDDPDIAFWRWLVKR